MRGLAAGLYAIVRLGWEVDGAALVRAARRRSVGVYPLGQAFMQPWPVHDGLVLGYANLTESAIEEGIRRLAGALQECAAAPAVSESGLAQSRIDPPPQRSRTYAGSRFPVRATAAP